MIGLATKVWQHARLAEATTEAVRKLTALGVDVDLTALDIVEPRLSADEPSFDVFWEATQERTPVVFDYVPLRRHRGPHPAPAALGRGALLRAAGTSSASTPTAQAERIFRLSRVQGKATKARPARLLRDPGRHRRERGGPPAGARAVDRAGRSLLVRKGAGHTLRRGADRVEEGVAGPDTRVRPGTGWCSSAARVGLADEVLGYGADVYVEEPRALRERVRRSGSRGARPGSAA